MFKKQLPFFLLLLFGTSLWAQYDLKIGQWKSHLPYNQGYSITQSADKVYYTEKFSVFSISKDENALDFLTKVEGLSDIGMSVIEYVDAHETLVITYANSNIDLLKPDEIVNLPFIKEDVNIVGDRHIYNIFQADDDLLYLACGFGVVELNVAREEFGFTTKMGIKVNDISVFENNFYAATDEGIYSVSNNSNLNLQDFGNWRLLGPADGFPEDYKCAALANYNNKLYLEINDTIFTLASDGLDFVHVEDGHEIVFLTAENEHLLAGAYCWENGEGCEGKVLIFNPDHSFETDGQFCVNRPKYAIEDEQGRIWYADNWRGIRVSNSNDNACNSIPINSPYSHHATEIHVDENNVWLATGTTSSGSDNGFYSLIDGEWSTYNRTTKTALRDLNAAYRITVHPVTKTVYVGSRFNGLIEMDTEENITFYSENENNAPLTDGSEENAIRVTGLAFDENNNLWMSNNTAQNPIVVLKSDGTWQNNFSSTEKALRQVVVDQSGNKWFTIDGTSRGVLVFNENDIDDPTDDTARILTTGNSQLPSNRVNCLAVDLDGDVWVGTRQGVAVFECGSNVFDPNCQGSRRIVQVDGFNAYLLETEDVTTIAVDGANRKWFGTLNGIFVQSPSGEEQIAFLDQDNSPLFSNIITDIGINQLSGEVYIGTANGMLSLRAEAIEGGIVNNPSAYAFPNPVRPEYDGPIAIKGLARDANVKITDVNGQLVFETTALGGQAIWDGRDYNGRRAASGVYLVFSTSTQSLENPDAIVTKILFMH